MGIREVIGHLSTMSDNMLSELDDDATLKTARQVRIAILNKQLESGLPSNADDFELVHKNLQALEMTALQNKRIKTDNDANENQAELIRSITVEMRKNAGRRDILISDDAISEVPDPVTEIEGKATLIEGELAVGTQLMNYDDFMRTRGRDIDERSKRGEINLKDFIVV